MIIKNETELLSEVIFEGVQYVIEAGKQITVDDTVGDFWVAQHEFLTVVKEDEQKKVFAKKKEEIKKDIAEEKKEAKEEVKKVIK